MIRVSANEDSAMLSLRLKITLSLKLKYFNVIVRKKSRQYVPFSLFVKHTKILKSDHHKMIKLASSLFSMIKGWFRPALLTLWCKLLITVNTYIFFSRGIISWIELPWPENSANTYARLTETLDSCFDLIRSRQQCIPWSPPLEIEPVTTDCRLYNWAINPYRTQMTPKQLVMVTACPNSLNCLASYIRTLCRGDGQIQSHVFPRGLEIRICVIIMTARSKQTYVTKLKICDTKWESNSLLTITGPLICKYINQSTGL